MTVEEVTREMCRILALAYQSIGDYRQPSDGFCDLCPGYHDRAAFRNEGRTIEYVRLAVVEKLKRDGHTIAEGFDPETGQDTSDRSQDNALAAKKKAIHEQFLQDVGRTK